ncbi:MAG: hypothetical protein JNM56_33010 [Planctomycetia bacterium]|nr:hypothetical protein [Planctomycetia bacterium]
MDPKDIQRYLRRQPFAPFRLVTSGGTTYDIKHPEMVLLSRRAVDIGLSSDPADTIAEHIVTVSLVHVQRLEAAGSTAEK